MAGEIPGTSVSFQIGDAATPTEVFTTVLGVASIPRIPAAKSPEIDVSALDSTAAEFILGLKDAGEFTMPINLRRGTSTGWIASQQTLEGYSGDNVLRGFKFIIKDATNTTTLVTYTGKCFVTAFEPINAAPNQAVQAEVTFRVSGAITKS
jgi:hypothetical protein